MTSWAFNQQRLPSQGTPAPNFALITLTCKPLGSLGLLSISSLFSSPINHPPFFTAKAWCLFLLPRCTLGGQPLIGPHTHLPYTYGRY